MSYVHVISCQDVYLHGSEEYTKGKPKKKSIGTDPAATLVMSAPLCHVLVTDNYRLYLW